MALSVKAGARSATDRPRRGDSAGFANCSTGISLHALSNTLASQKKLIAKIIAVDFLQLC